MCRESQKIPQRMMSIDEKADIAFWIFHNPRKEKGALGDYICDRCGSVSSVYLDIYINGHPASVCKGCLTKGINMINKAIIETAKRK